MGKIEGTRSWGIMESIFRAIGLLLFTVVFAVIVQYAVFEYPLLSVVICTSAGIAVILKSIHDTRFEKKLTEETKS